MEQNNYLLYFFSCYSEINMKNTFSLEQISKAGDLNGDLTKRQYKLDTMAKFMDSKISNWRLKQSETTRELKISSSTLQRYKR